MSTVWKSEHGYNLCHKGWKFAFYHFPILKGRMGVLALILLVFTVMMSFFFAHFPMQFAHCFTCTRYLLSYKCFVCLCQNYDHLFKINEKKAGGSFYLQSKVRLHFALYVSTQLSWIGKNSPLLRHACLHVVT